jgi:hypothetical protein
MITNANRRYHRPPVLISKAHDWLNARAFWCLSVLLLGALTPLRATGQVMPVLRVPLRLSVFGTFTDAKPHLHYYADGLTWGFTTGGIMQLPRFGGVELRGSMLRSGSYSHQESALIGPRLAMHIFHMSPYGSLLFGEGNARWQSNPPRKSLPPPRLDEDHGFQWAIVAGVDFHLRNRVSLRVGELSFSKIYTPSKTLTPFSASTGLVFRIN